MSFIVEEMAAVVADLTAAGVPATADPGAVYTFAAQYPVMALVTPPEEVRTTVGLAGLALDVQVWLLTRPPNDLAAQDRLGDGMLSALPAALPLGPVEGDQWEGSDGVELPGYRWRTGRSLNYPTT